MSYQTKIRSNVQTATNTHDFGVADVKGRAIGATVTLCTVTYSDLTDADKNNGTGGYSYYRIEPGVWFVAEYQATRAGVPFGPAFNRAMFKTEVERDAGVAKYLKAAAKRAAKTAAK